MHPVGPDRLRIADELEAVLHGEVDRLMIMIPPRHGKKVALWRYMNGGLVPTDAVIRRACQREPVAA